MSALENNTQTAKTGDDVKQGLVKTISKNVDSEFEPVEIFQGLTELLNLDNSILLESSQIESRQNVKSILMLQAAVRIECFSHQVMIEALTANGKNALHHIANQFISTRSECKIKLQNETLSIDYPTLSNNLDEDARLKQLTPIDCLRVIKNSFSCNSANEFSIFLAGLFAYDLIATFEKLPEVQSANNDCADFVFYLAESLLVIDHERNTKRFMCNHFSGENEQNTYFELARSFDTLEMNLTKLANSALNNLVDIAHPSNEVKVDLNTQQYQDIVVQLKQNIIQGDIFQVVPSRTFSLACPSPINSYRELKRTNPSPYMFYMRDKNFVLFGASPESSLKYDANTNAVELYPIAGTRPRGKNSFNMIDVDLDARIEAELKLDQKEVSEHMMLVDLARNDVARISTPGTTHVPRLLEVDRYSQVMHLVSCVQGKLRSDLDALHAYQACMNMGTLTGAPKIRATELIRQVEGKRRGSYGGAIGYLNGNGDMDSCIVIRSAFCKNGIAYIQAGAGIVYDSIPLMEAKETEAKAAAVINAIQSANSALPVTPESQQ